MSYAVNGEQQHIEGGLQGELDAFLAFATGGVLLWHDPDGAFADSLGALSLPGGSMLVRESELSCFDLLRRVNALAPDETLLLYRAGRHRVEQDDWLADAEAYAECFSPEVEPYMSPASITDEEPVEMQTKLASFALVPEVELDQDWYSLVTLRSLFGITDEAVLSVAVSAYGFRLFPDCSVRTTWKSPAAYYRTLFSTPLVAHSSLPEALRAAPSFTTYLVGAMAAGEVLEYDEETWITAAGLVELEIAPSDLDAFVQQAVECAMRSGVPQFTVPWLRANATEVPLMDYGLADCFYETALLSRKRLVKRGHLGGRRIFAEPHTQARGRDLVESVVRVAASLNMEDLLDVLREDYGIPIQRAQLVTLVRQTSLFFSPELDRVYRDHDQFVREVE